MTLYEFNALNTSERAGEAVQGKFIDVRSDGRFKVALYSHEHFYTEVFYDGIVNQVVKAHAFTSACLLAAYVRLNEDGAVRPPLMRFVNPAE